MKKKEALSKTTHNPSTCTGQLTRADSYFNERLRQARVSFNLAVGLTTASTIFGLVLIFQLLNGHVSTDTATTAGWLITEVVNVCVLNLCKEANDRLDESTKAREEGES